MSDQLSGLMRGVVDLNTGQTVAHISYNGKVRAGTDWKSDSLPLYQPGKGVVALTKG